MRNEGGSKGIASRVVRMSNGGEARVGEEKLGNGRVSR